MLKEIIEFVEFKYDDYEVIEIRDTATSYIIDIRSRDYDPNNKPIFDPIYSLLFDKNSKKLEELDNIFDSPVINSGKTIFKK